MNLLDRIDARLADPQFSLDREMFERASVSMLSDIYLNLVPITGGSDDGRDAEIIGPNGARIGVLVTSARDLDGVLANLRGGCRQMKKKNVPIRRVVLANIAELNASKRSKIAAAAASEGFMVEQIHPRAWYADALRRNPSWRSSLLGLTGAPYTLTRPPAADLAVDVDATVGRAEQLAALNAATSDVVVTGVPGAGKTHLVAQTDDVVFVEKTSQLDDLTDHLLETDPSVVAIDDVGGRIAVLQELLVVRRAHKLRFRIVAVCWPHETNTITDVVTNSEQLLVDRMTKPELGQILRVLGITRDAILSRILDQARGRPAWAVRLALLLKDDTGWGDLLRGDYLRLEVSRYLRTARITGHTYDNHAYDVLATLALVGTVNDTEFGQVAGILGTDRLGLRDTILKLAVSGLLDANEMTVDGRRSVSYSVQPELLAVSVVADAYFSDGAPPVPLGDIEAALPSRQPVITLNRVLAEVVGAERPERPAQADVIVAIEGKTGEAREPLLRHYAMLGHSEAIFVLSLVTEQLREVCRARTQADPNGYAFRYDKSVERRGMFLAELAARTSDEIGVSASMAYLGVGSGLMLDAGDDIEPYLDQFFAVARRRDLGEPVSAGILESIAVAVAGMPITSANERLVFAGAAARSLAPSWDAHYTAPDQPRTLNLRAFLLPAGSCLPIATPVLDRIERDPVDASMFPPLVDALKSWVHIARGYALPHGLVPTSEHREAATTIAHRLANLMARPGLTSGTRLMLNRAAQPIGLSWPEPDALFAALTASPEAIDDHEGDDPDADSGNQLVLPDADGKDDDPSGPRAQEAIPEARRNIHAAPADPIARWEARQQAQVDAIAAAVGPFLEQHPATLCARLVELLPMFDVDTKTTARTDLVFTHIATTNADPVLWLRTAADHDLARFAGALIETIFADDSFPDDLLHRLLGDQSTRRMVIHYAITSGKGQSLSLTVADVRVEDFGPRLPDSFVRVSPAALTCFYDHDDRQVTALAMTSWAMWLDFVDRRSPVDRGRADAQLAAVPEWTNAMRDLVAPAYFDEHTLERGLVSLARHAPDIFMGLFAAHVEGNLYSADDMDQWAPGAQVLSDADRIVLWRRTRGTFADAHVFWAIAGDDIAWIADRFQQWGSDWDGQSIAIPISALLVAPQLNDDRRPANEHLAALFADYAEPHEIINALPDTFSGEQVERVQHRLNQATELAASADPKAATVGRRGVSQYTEALRTARREARARELKGDTWF